MAEPLSQPAPPPPPPSSSSHAQDDLLAAPQPGGPTDAADDGHDELRLLSRSPHPYHHRSHELPHAAEALVYRDDGGGDAVTTDRATTSSSWGGPPKIQDGAPTRPDEGPRRRSSPSTGPFSKESTPASGDSGTEADNEHGLWKGLPAPRPRPHKGLRRANWTGRAAAQAQSPPPPTDGKPQDQQAEGSRRRAAADESDELLLLPLLPLSGAATPLTMLAASPERLEEEGRRVLLGASARRAAQGGDRERRALAERVARRKELVRRAVEVALVAAVGAMVLCANEGAAHGARVWKTEILTLCALVAVLCALYPLAVVVWGVAFHGGWPSWSRSFGLAMPSAFDPAPLLYPPTMTLFVSLLVSVDNLSIVLPNVVLAISSLPEQLVPALYSAGGSGGYNPTHWFLSCLPLLTSTCTGRDDDDGLLARPLFAAAATAEVSALLYPLHRSLCAVLHCLTTTSLLPAELQLLSIALINTLFFSVSPQAVVLKALLWGGGLSLLILCGRVVRRGISLARVPKWRFRRPDRRERSRRPLLARALAGLAALRRAPKVDAFGDPIDSDASAAAAEERRSSDEDNHRFYDGRRAGQAGLALKKRATLADWMLPDGTAPAAAATSPLSPGSHVSPSYRPMVESLPVSPAGDDPMRHAAAFQLGGAGDGTAVGLSQQPLPAPSSTAAASQQPTPPSGSAVPQLLAPLPKVVAAARRHTLPTDTPQSGHHGAFPPPPPTHTASGRRRRAASGSVRAFFALTAEQAARRRWAYAAYLYAAVAAVALGVVRPYVGARALGGAEPAGWALGYLLGDVPRFRLEVVLANWERWICLPPRGPFGSASSSPSSETEDDAMKAFLCRLGWLPRLRLGAVGVANTRLCLAGYWLGVLVLGLTVVLRLSPVFEVDTRRKVFHFTMVAMLLPATFVDPAFAALALSLALALFLLVDLLRASQLPPLSRPIAHFLAPYVDGRDLRGPVVVSHIFLLVGCAIPLWLSLASLPRGLLPPADAAGSVVVSLPGTCGNSAGGANGVAHFAPGPPLHGSTATTSISEGLHTSASLAAQALLSSYRSAANSPASALLLGGASSSNVVLNSSSSSSFPPSQTLGGPGGGCLSPRAGLPGWELPTREVGMVAGVVCVGLGDAAASLVGRRWGRSKWLWAGGKSLEGSAAFAAAVFLGLVAAKAWLRLGGWVGEEGYYYAGPGPVGEVGPGDGSWGGAAVASALLQNPAQAAATARDAAICAAVASLTEAVLTGGNDNVIVPVVLWTCVKSLGV